MKKHYDFKESEPKWQKEWQRMNYWKFNPNDEQFSIFVIDTPPPFTNGELHMGHAYWVWINDTIARYKRMCGYNVLLPQGWDCQGLPTELKIQKILKSNDMDREMFRKACVEFTIDMISKMKRDMIKIGYTPDWNFEYRTMDKTYHKYVQETLIDMFNKKMIYKGTFPTYWCPNCETTVAQAETGYVEHEGFLYYISFATELDEKITIATTRPELLPACQAIAVHPSDNRYKRFIGRRAYVPLLNKPIPILADEEVDTDFGTGAVMICSYGDEQDIKWIKKHNLPETIIIDEKGRICNTNLYDGMTIKDARIKIVEDLHSAGLLERKEKITHKVLSHTERGDCGAPIEFIPRPQYFIKVIPMKDELWKLADKIKWTPEYMKSKFNDWVESITWDWIISRQRIFGTPLPFWYCKKCGHIILPKKENLPVDPTKDSPPVEKCPKCGSSDIIGESSVCDVWIDSSITPLIITKFFEDKGLFTRLYPVSLRQQGYEIIRTWAFYTIHRCYNLTGQLPWREILINGMILGPDGKEMSKSRGNVISPLEGIAQYGADAMRFALLRIKIGEDFAFDWKDVKFASRFIQKVWNSYRLLWLLLKRNDLNIAQAERITMSHYFLDSWMLSKLREFLTMSQKYLEQYRFDLYLKGLHSIFWTDFCSTYLELIKYRLYNRNAQIRYQAIYTLYSIMWIFLRLMAPILPHLTEEIYYNIFKPVIKYESIHESSWPSPSEISEEMELDICEKIGKTLKEHHSIVRRIKKEKGLSYRDTLESLTLSAEKTILRYFLNSVDELQCAYGIKKLIYKAT